jgi:(1->4)-alpha-D-glucan 1-alpha-D-glucosylmutase
MTALTRLAEALGIGRAYHDAFGQHREVPAETLRAACATLGFDAGDDAAAEQALAALHLEQWSELAPPVIAVRGDVAVETPLNALDPFDDATLSWELRGENGEIRTGQVRWGDLQLIGSSDAHGARAERRMLRIADRIAPGYYDLALGFANAPHIESLLIAAPARGFEPHVLRSGGRAWVLATQLYSLRTDGNWGMGDFTSLAELLGRAGEVGAAGAGINPLHSLFADEPERASPYSPASRQFLSPLYLAIPAIEDFAESDDAQRRLAELQGEIDALNRAAHVDYTRVAALKFEMLRVVYAGFRERHLAHADDPRARDFRAFQAEGGEMLRRFATFETLRATFGATDPSRRYWRHWPEDYRRPDNAAVAAFAQEHLAEVEFHEYLQWQADQQLAQAAERGHELAVGLYCDLAVGIDSGGADAWANQDVVAIGFAVGAPPDPWAHQGQNWGFPPPNPRSLRRSRYRMFIEMLRANMRHAGALRIDHVLGLKRLFWIPEGRPTWEGTYVAYPFEEMLAIAILESHRNQCLVIGEDLGTLPEGLREELSAANIYSYRLLIFEREGDRFHRPGEYPEAALAAISTHDLPTLAGFWAATDIQLRERFGSIPSAEERDKAYGARAWERELLWRALGAEQLGGEDAGEGPPRLALHRFLGRSRARLTVVQLDDAIDETDQINLPGTDREHPNWRRRYAMTVAEIFADPRAQSLFAVMRQERPL